MSNALNVDPILLGDNKPGRQITDLTLTVEKLNSRLQVLEHENQKFLKQKNRIQKKSDEEQQDFESILELLLQETAQFKDEISNVEFKFLNEKKENNDLEQDLNKAYEEKKRKFDELKSDLSENIKSLEQKLDQISQFTDEQNKLEEASALLKEQLEIEKKEKKRVLADQEREKVQATDKLSKDMHFKIEETKVQLLALKKEQIATTNRLTVLQNHQLTTELEYQSKQTEKLLFRNSKLMEQISQLKRDVEIHKQVEQELAKRSQNSQKQIKNLSQQIKDLEETNEKLKKERDQLQEPEESDILQQKKKEEFIESMEKQLEITEKKHSKVMNDLEILKNEQFYLQSRLDSTESRNTNLGQVLAHVLENFKNDTPGVYDDITPQDYQDDQQMIKEIRKKDVLDWDIEEKEFVISHLLNKIRSLISRKNLVINHGENKNVNVQVIQEDGAEQINKSQDQGNNNNNSQLSGNYNNRYSSMNNGEKSSLVLPKIGGGDSENYNASKSYDNQKRFKGVPVDISSQIVKGNVRDWGKQAVTMPSNNKKAKQLQRRFKMN